MSIFNAVKIGLTLFLLLSFSAYGQEATLVFYPKNNVLSVENENLIRETIANKLVKSCKIEAYVSNDSLISKNRVLQEYQVQSIKRFLENSSEGLVSCIVQPIKIMDSVIENQVKLSIAFKSVLGKRELKNTSVVRIVQRYAKLESNPESKLQEALKPKPMLKPKPKKIVKQKKESEQSILAKSSFKKGEKIRIPNLIFTAGTAIPKNQSKASLRELFTILEERPSMNIELHGHVCCEWSVLGSPAYIEGFCQDLSEARAKAVYSYLISKGIDQTRLRYVGFGYRRKLKDDYGNVEAANLNRRVEVFVVSE